VALTFLAEKVLPSDSTALQKRQRDNVTRRLGAPFFALPGGQIFALLPFAEYGTLVYVSTDFARSLETDISHCQTTPIGHFALEKPKIWKNRDTMS